MSHPADLKVGGLYQFSGDLVNGKRWFELALYDEINEYFQHAKNTVALDMFVLLEREERGFPYHGLYWLKILTTTGIVGWIIANLDFEFKGLKEE